MKKSLLIGAVLLSSLSFGQKKNETSAAVEFKNKYIPAVKSGDLETAKKSILSAKEFIDLAADHPDTKTSSKTLYYKGEIYFAIFDLGERMNDTDLKAMATTDFIGQSISSFGKANEDNKWSTDVLDAAYRAQSAYDKKGNAAYSAENFNEAAMMYSLRAQFMQAAGILDSGAVFYSAVCSEKAGDFKSAAMGYYQMAKAGYKEAVSYNLASGAFRKAGDVAKAKEIISEGRKLYPNDRDLLLELVNINIDENNPAGAEQALNEAIASDPKNKQLYYTIGTIYIELKQNDKAEQSLNKALEIDPDYLDAQYQLGAHLVSWGGDLKTEASNLKIGDARYDVLLAQSNDTYKRALIPLEKYIAKNPKDAQVLTILYQLQRALGNSEKAAEYKKRAAEAK